MPDYTPARIHKELARCAPHLCPEIYHWFLSMPDDDQVVLLAQVQKLSSIVYQLGIVGALELCYKLGRWMAENNYARR